MKIKKIHLFNWMIFKGNQEVDFASDESNVTVIYGENMHGKTSLLNAIRWCLYGEAINRQGTEISASQLINIEALNEGDSQLRVKLEMTVDGNEYELNRELIFEDSKPSNSKSLRVNGRFVEGGKIEQIVEYILPKQISQFMLFDGELLKNFENLVVSTGSNQAKGIKNSIEQALGMPTLHKANEEIKNLLKKYKSEAKQELDKNAQARQIGAKIEELEVKKSSAEQDKDSLINSLETNQNELSELSDVMRDNEESIKLIEKKQNAQEALDGLNVEKMDLRDKLLDMSSSMWMVPLKQQLEPIIANKRRELEELKTRVSDHATKVLEVYRLEKSLASSQCPTCNNQIEEQKINEIKSNVQELKTELLNYEGADDLIYNLTSSIKSFDFISEFSDNTDVYKMLEEQIKSKEFSELEIENKIENLDQQLKDVDQQKSMSTRIKYEALLKEIGVLEDNIDTAENNIEVLDEEIRQLTKSPAFQELAGDSNALKRSERGQRLQQVIKLAIDEYRNEMREAVKQRATITFGQLTTEKTFDELDINESYGLNLVVGGQVVNRSAGAEQIVALSLIEALNYHGRRQGPMIMDTPVGRLDNSHRKNILRYLPTTVTQLAIFAHSGELKDGSNLIDAQIIGAKYQIERNSTFCATIVKV